LCVRENKCHTLRNDSHAQSLLQKVIVYIQPCQYYIVINNLLCSYIVLGNLFQRRKPSEVSVISTVCYIIIPVPTGRCKTLLYLFCFCNVFCSSHRHYYNLYSHSFENDSEITAVWPRTTTEALREIYKHSYQRE